MNQYQMMMNAQQAGMKQNFMATNQNSFSSNMMNGKMNMNPNGMQQAQPGMSNVSLCCKAAITGGHKGVHVPLFP